MNIIIADGGNKEGTYGSYKIYDQQGNLIITKEFFWGVGDHNQAEYWILLEAVNYATKNNITDIVIFTDSETVAEQLTFDRPLYKSHLKKIRNTILLELNKMNSWEIRRVDRSLMKTFLGH